MSKELKKIEALSEEFLYELYAEAIRNVVVCGVLAQHMQLDFLPDKDFQQLNKALTTHFKAFKEPPTTGMLIEKLKNDAGALELFTEIQEHSCKASTEAILATLEDYIKTVKLQKTYVEIGKLYNRDQRDEAMVLMQKYAEWLSGFTLASNQFVDIIGDFELNYQKNQQKQDVQKEQRKKRINRFYIDKLDAMNNGRDLRTQLTCFLAAAGVGKSHIIKHIGKHAAIEDGLDVLHIQLEGSEQEAVDAYSGGLIEQNSYTFERAKLTNVELKESLEKLKKFAGTIRVRAFTRFNNTVSTVDIKNAIAEYRKTFGYNPDVVLIDSLDLLTDASGKRWDAEHTRHKYVAAARDLKDLAADEDVWIAVTYQATVEKPDWLNDPKNVLTEYSASECKGLSRPMTHFISLNQTADERQGNMMRIHVAKSRFFGKENPTFRIATKFSHEIFYDRIRSLNLQ